MTTIKQRLRRAADLAAGLGAIAISLLEDAAAERRAVKEGPTDEDFDRLSDEVLDELHQLRIDLAEEIRVGAEGRAAADKVRADLEEAHRKRAELETKLAVAQKAIEGADGERGRLHSAIDNEVARREAADSQYERIRARLVDLRQEADDAIARATRAEGDLAKARAGWQDIAAAEQKTGDQAAAERDKAQELLKQVREQNGRLAAMIKDLQADVQRLEVERDEARRRLESLHAALRHATETWRQHGPGDADRRAEVLPDIANLVEWLLKDRDHGIEWQNRHLTLWTAAQGLLEEAVQHGEGLAKIHEGALSNRESRFVARYEEYCRSLAHRKTPPMPVGVVAAWLYSHYRRQRLTEILPDCDRTRDRLVPSWELLSEEKRQRFHAIARAALGMGVGS